MTFDWLAHPESALFFLVGLVALLLASVFKKNLFSPPLLYLLVQSFMFGIAYLKLMPAMTDYQLNTWLVWGGGLFSFLSACYLARLSFRFSNYSLVLPETLSLSTEYNWKSHFILSFLALAFFLYGVLGVVSIAGNLVLLTDNPSLWLDGKTSKVLSYAIFFTSSPMVVALFGVASFKSYNPIRWIRNTSKIICLLTIVLSFLTFPSRGVNLMCVGFLFILANYLYKRITWKMAVVVASLILFFFIGVASVKGQYGEMDVMNNELVDEVALLPYKYIANNYWNLDYAFNRASDVPEHSWTYGIDAFYGITHLLSIGPGLQASFGWDTPFNESIEKVSSLNTIPYLWDAYKDFGYPGIFLVPFFWGFIFTFLYKKMPMAKTPLSLLFHTTFSFWIILWNFTTGYKQAMYIIWFLFFFFVCTVSSGKGLFSPANRTILKEVTPENERDDDVSTECKNRDCNIG